MFTTTFNPQQQLPSGHTSQSRTNSGGLPSHFYMQQGGHAAAAPASQSSPYQQHHNYPEPSSSSDPQFAGYGVGANAQLRPPGGAMLNQMVHGNPTPFTSFSTSYQQQPYGGYGQATPSGGHHTSVFPQPTATNPFGGPSNEFSNTNAGGVPHSQTSRYVPQQPHHQLPNAFHGLNGFGDTQSQQVSSAVSNADWTSAGGALHFASQAHYNPSHQNAAFREQFPPQSSATQGTAAVGPNFFTSIVNQQQHAAPQLRSQPAPFMQHNSIAPNATAVRLSGQQPAASSSNNTHSMFHSTSSTTSAAAPSSLPQPPSPMHQQPYHQPPAASLGPTTSIAAVLASATSQIVMQNGFTAAIDCESSKLYLPTRCIRNTEALTRAETVKPALCRLFLNGRCRQGQRCHQIHAEPSIVLRLRSELMSRPPCCLMHSGCSTASHQAAIVAELHPQQQQDAPPTTLNPSPFALELLPPSVRVQVDGVEISIPQLELTKGLFELVEKQLAVPAPPVAGEHQSPALLLMCTASQLCRNHVHGALCRFGDDCGYLHVCKSLGLRNPSGPTNSTIHNSSMNVGMPPVGGAASTSNNGARHASTLPIVLPSHSQQGHQPLVHPIGGDYATPQGMASYGVSAGGPLTSPLPNAITSDPVWSSMHTPSSQDPFQSQAPTRPHHPISSFGGLPSNSGTSSPTATGGGGDEIGAGGFFSFMPASLQHTAHHGDPLSNAPHLGPQRAGHESSSFAAPPGAPILSPVGAGRRTQAQLPTFGLEQHHHGASQQLLSNPDASVSLSVPQLPSTGHLPLHFSIPAQIRGSPLPGLMAAPDPLGTAHSRPPNQASHPYAGSASNSVVMASVAAVLVTLEDEGNPLGDSSLFRPPKLTVASDGGRTDTAGPAGDAKPVIASGPSSPYGVLPGTHGDAFGSTTDEHNANGTDACDSSKEQLGRSSGVLASSNPHLQGSLSTHGRYRHNPYSASTSLLVTAPDAFGASRDRIVALGHSRSEGFEDEEE